VHVDESRRDQHSARVDLPSTSADVGAYRDDPAAFDRNISQPARRAGTVDHGAVSDDEIVHVTVSLDETTVVVNTEAQ
jgi:hypothetical protein